MRCAALLAAVSLAAADQLEYTAYYFGDNSENTVATTSFSLAKTLVKRTMLLLDIELDQLTIPPLDVVTGASRPARQSNREFQKSRGQVIAGFEQGLGDNTRVAANYYFSQETDYRSQAVIGSITQELLQKNLTITLRGQYTLDSVGEIITSTGALFNRFKETHLASIAVTQLLSPTSVLTVGGDGVRNQGFLSDPYRHINIPDPANPAQNILVQEKHPSLRFRQAGWAELSKFIRELDGSVSLKYRYYWDDWGLKSHTAQIKINKYITPDWIASPEYRYYTQTGANFGTYANGDPSAYYTGDYKLKPFDSNNIGLGVTCFLRAFSKRRPDWDFLNNTAIAAMYFRYFNNSGPSEFSANVLETRIKFTY